MSNLKVGIKGMHCASCAKIIERELLRDKNVSSVFINPVSEEAEINSRELFNHQDANKRLEKIGYQLVVPEDEKIPTSLKNNLQQHKAEKKEELESRKKKLRITLPLMIAILTAVFWEMAAEYFNLYPTKLIPTEILMPIIFVSATLIIFWMGRDFLLAAGRFFSTGKANMDTLIGIGTGTAYFYSALIYLFPIIKDVLKLPSAYFFDVTVVVITLVYLGKYLESKAKMSTNETLEKLLSLQTKTALIEKDGQEKEIHLSQLQVGDIAIIKPGMKIPADGEVIDGQSAIDEALISGESLPVDKQKGDRVIGSTINKQGVLKIRIDKVGADTVLAAIIRSVEKAQNSKAPIQKLADQVSGIFVPIVLAFALITMLIWLTVGSSYIGWTGAVSLGITCFVSVLAIACPCALGLATPTGIMVGLGLSSKNGLLIKNAASLEKFGKTKIVAFDKTGTITAGEPTVTDIIAITKNRSTIISLAASLENNSEHPLALAIVKIAKEENINTKKTTNFSSLPGRGIQGEIDKHSYWLGSIELAKDMGVSLPEQEITVLEKQGKTIMVLGDKLEAMGIIVVADQIKPSAKIAIANLKELGIKTVMITGDRQNAAEYIAGQAGIETVWAGVSPDEKANRINILKSEGVTAMLGDGVNDAVALTSADVGIAMSNGSDVAIESADITILKGDLNKVVSALKISRLTMRKIKQNLFWAFFYNIVALPIAAGLLYPINGWLLSPIIAAGAMSLSSLSIIFNTLLMKRAKI